MVPVAAPVVEDAPGTVDDSTDEGPVAIMYEGPVPMVWGGTPELASGVELVES